MCVMLSWLGKLDAFALTGPSGQTQLLNQHEMVDDPTFGSFLENLARGFISSDAVHPAECRYANAQPNVCNYSTGNHQLFQADSITR